MASLDLLEEGQVIRHRAERIWEFIVDYTKRHGQVPVLKKISQELDIPEPSLRRHINKLEAQGFIRKSWNKRSYVLLRER